MNSLRAISILLWITTYFYLTDSKGGGGNDEVVVNPVSVTHSGNSHVGGNINLTCSFPSIKKPGSLFWFKHKDIIFVTGVGTYQLPRINEVSKDDFRISKRHELILKFVVMDDSDKYKCLIIQEDGKGVEGVYTLSIQPDIYTVKQGEDQRLRCENNGPIEYPRILIWEKDASIIVYNGTINNSPTSYDLYHSGLVIKNVSSLDEGTYTCYSDGKRVHVYQIKLYKDAVVIPIQQSSLAGWRGIAVGASIAVLIIAALLTSCYIQSRPFKAV